MSVRLEPSHGDLTTVMVQDYNGALTDRNRNIASAKTILDCAPMTSYQTPDAIRDLRDDDLDHLDFATNLRDQPATRLKHPDWQCVTAARRYVALVHNVRPWTVACRRVFPRPVPRYLLPRSVSCGRGTTGSPWRLVADYRATYEDNKVLEEGLYVSRIRRHGDRPILEKPSAMA